MKKLLSVFLFVFALPVFATGIGSGSSAPCDNATLSKYTGTANIEIDWEPNTIQLNWYDGNTKLNVSTDAQSCVYDGMITVPPQPTKLGYTFNGWKVWKPTVSNGYTQLEYIQSDGTQYINTGHTHVANETYEIDVMIDSVDSGWRAIMGAAPGGSNGHFYISKVGGTPYLCNIAMPSGSLPLHTKLNIKLVQSSNAVSAYVDGVLKHNAGVTTYGYPLLLLARNGTEPPTIGKLYGARVYNASNELVQNFLPARRNSDNVLGMFDTVSGNFFTNAGTGTFTAGPTAQ